MMYLMFAASFALGWFNQGKEKSLKPTIILTMIPPCCVLGWKLGEMVWVLP